MADPSDLNGPLLEVLPPHRPVIPEIPRLGPRSGWPELAAGYATVAAAFAQHVPAVYAELNEMRGAINLLGVHAMPAMRRSADSSHSTHGIASDIAQSARIDAQKLVEIDPELQPHPGDRRRLGRGEGVRRPGGQARSRRGQEAAGRRRQARAGREGRHRREQGARQGAPRLPAQPRHRHRRRGIRVRRGRLRRLHGGAHPGARRGVRGTCGHRPHGRDRAGAAAAARARGDGRIRRIQRTTSASGASGSRSKAPVKLVDVALFVVAAIVLFGCGGNLGQRRTRPTRRTSPTVHCRSNSVRPRWRPVPGGGRARDGARDLLRRGVDALPAQGGDPGRGRRMRAMTEDEKRTSRCSTSSGLPDAGRMGRLLLATVAAEAGGGEAAPQRHLHAGAGQVGARSWACSARQPPSWATRAASVRRTPSARPLFRWLDRSTIRR